MPRPIMLSIAGDSGSGKTTITRGVVRVLGEEKVTHFCADDYHRYDRRQRAERGITPLDPECNYIDVLSCDIRHLRHNEAILKPVYRHADGTFGPPVYMSPARFVVAEGLLINHTAELREMFDIRVYLNPPEELRRRWKVARDCSRRGYSTGQVLTELDRRERDSEAYIRPQRHHADIVLSFMPGRSQEPDQLDAHLFLRDSLPHPDLAGVVGNGADDDLTLTEHSGEQELRIPGTLSTYAEMRPQPFRRRAAKGKTNPGERQSGDRRASDPAKLGKRLLRAMSTQPPPHSCSESGKVHEPRVRRLVVLYIRPRLSPGGQ